MEAAKRERVKVRKRSEESEYREREGVSQFKKDPINLFLLGVAWSATTKKGRK